MTIPIEDYALVGDMQTAALVSRGGSVDWLCVPRFDSGACFAALLGEPRHGRWLLGPAGQVRSARRRYRESTLVLETEIETQAGVVRLVDFMPPRERHPALVRIVEGVRGTVPVRMELVIRYDYGSIVPWVQAVDGVLRAVAGPDALALRTTARTRGEGLTTVSDLVVSDGDRVPFVLQWHPSHEPPPPPLDTWKCLEDTEAWWRAWASRSTYRGPWRDAVLRSLITLKALTHQITGGIVAAPTTSLPESMGGVRNWDYRFCWLRDATFTLYALLVSGYREEAARWREWLLRAAAGDPADLQIMYGLGGERRSPEVTLDWLPGYAASRPVRIGNAAVHQRQLDVYGEVMDAMHQAHRSGIPPEPSAWGLQRALLDFLESSWQGPDEGLWEVRGTPQHFTHSKVMTWVAFDRAIKAIEGLGRDGPLERWRGLRARIHREVCQRSVDRQRGCFTMSYESSRLDASLLMIPLVGFLPPNDDRVVATVRAIEQELLRDGLVSRYQTAGEDGLPPGEGAFLACSFWLADNYALAGRAEEARRLFERLLGLRNDVGLLAEEYDPVAGLQLGNFPQAFSHVGLVNTAFNLTPRLPKPAEHRQQT
ncbi:MAG TPA: glycoside hydrolase family 15 protein [Anaeromyxobacteraceae bacterium]|nr:glycoside hydrolase family 15 protein [Anaeromyxobacteraceae bacterium]